MSNSSFWGTEDIEGAEGATGEDAVMTSLTADVAAISAEASDSAVDTAEVVAAGGGADALAATGELLEATLADNGEGASPAMVDSVNASLEALQNAMKLPANKRTRLAIESNATVAERRAATMDAIESIADTGKAYWARFVAWIKQKWAEFKTWFEKTFSYLDKASKNAAAFESQVSTLDGSAKEPVKNSKAAGLMDYYGDMSSFLPATYKGMKEAYGQLDKDLATGKVLVLNPKAKLKVTGAKEGSGSASIEVVPNKSEKKELPALSAEAIKSLAAAAVAFGNDMKNGRTHMRAYEATVNASIKEIEKAAGSDEAARAAAEESKKAARAKVGNIIGGSQAMIKYGVQVLNDALLIGHASAKLYKAD